jgi:hypothetical protein
MAVKLALMKIIARLVNFIDTQKCRHNWKKQFVD